MATEYLWQTDAYLKEFDATVTALDDAEVGLDRTAFYPGGGGQPHDVGVLVAEGITLPVLRAERVGEQVWHRLNDTPPPAGMRVRGKIDWDRRYKLMRTHTALHVLCGVVFRDYGALVTGGNMEPLQARMDFEFERMQKELVEEIEASVNREVAQARDVFVRILPREEAFRIPDLIRTKINLLPPTIEQVRIVHIVGLDLQADGGTHVANTREIGRVRVIGYESKGKINKRIRIQVQ